MGISNGRAHLERKISGFLAELEERRRAEKAAAKAAAELPDLRSRITHLEQLVSAAELLLREDDPTWNCSRVKPKRKKAFQSPFPIGEAAPMALGVLREAKEPMRVRDIVVVMLARLGITEYDRVLVDKQANSLGAYLTNHSGDLVESDGSWAKKWKVIR